MFYSLCKPLLFFPLTFFQQPVIKCFSKRSAQGLFGFFFPITGMSMWLESSQAPFKQTANYLGAATKVNYKYVNCGRIKYSLNIRHLLWKLSVIRCIKGFLSACSCGVSLQAFISAVILTNTEGAPHPNESRAILNGCPELKPKHF